MTKFRAVIFTATLTAFILFSSSVCIAQFEKQNLSHFEKIIVSPHIELILEQGEEESVVIQDSRLDLEKINIKVVGNTLRIYLDEAKTITKYKKKNEEVQNWNSPMYSGKMLTVQVTYKSLKKLSVRGEEVTILNEISAKKFRLKLFGEVKMQFASMNVGKLKTSLYGEN